MLQPIYIASKSSHIESSSLDIEFQNVIDHAVDGINIPLVSEEFKLLLKYYITDRLLKNGETVGTKVYKLRLVDGHSPGIQDKPNRNQLIFYNAINLIIPYIFRRKDLIKTHLANLTCNHKVPWLHSENHLLIFRAIKVLNFIIFLIQGKYLSLAERVSRIVPVVSDTDYHTSTAINRVQIDLIARGIIWRELASFLSTVIPYIKTEKIRFRLVRLLSGFRRETVESNLAKCVGHQINLDSCGICESQPFNPYTIGCRHVFCYYCLESRHLLDSGAGYSCTKCNYMTKNVSEVRRHKVYTVSGLEDEVHQ